MSTEPLLSVEGLHTTFTTRRGELRAVTDVSLSLDSGETLGLVGESGSGKSVLGKTIMGLISTGRATSVTGTVTFLGTDIASLNRSQQQELWGNDIAMVFQDPMSSLNPFKRVGTHVTETLRAHRGLDRRAARTRAIELLRKVQIPEPARRFAQYPHELSGGMRQRVVIAMALACDPKLTIADEATTALDVTVQMQILELLESLREETGMATIMISHDLGVVAGRTDRVAVMYAGRIVETGATREVFASPQHPYTRALLAAVPRLAAEPHTELASIEGGLPDMTRPATGCSFAPRCAYAQRTCVEVIPPLQPHGAEGASAEPRHETACHFPILPGRHGADASGVPPIEPTPRAVP